MPEQLSAAVTWTSRLHFEGRSEHDHAVPIDFPPPLGEGEGIKPMELLLMSLASCSGQTVVSLLQKMRQDVRAFSVHAAGVKGEDHPKVFTEIRLEFHIEGAGIDPAAAEKAVRLSEEKYCPVWAMLKGGPAISFSIKLHQGTA